VLHRDRLYLVSDNQEHSYLLARSAARVCCISKKPQDGLGVADDMDQPCYG